MTTEAEAQTENREAEDPTMTEEASFQIPSHTATDLPTEETEAEAVLGCAILLAELSASCDLHTPSPDLNLEGRISGTRTPLACK